MYDTAAGFVVSFVAIATAFATKNSSLSLHY
jgi:hypothetical protein